MAVSHLTRANVRAFMDRDWALSRAAKDRAVGNFVRAHGATAAFALAQGLLDSVWPRLRQEEEARNDLASLVALKERFARAGTASR